MWEPSQRYPDPAVQVLDASFGSVRIVAQCDGFKVVEAVKSRR